MLQVVLAVCTAMGLFFCGVWFLATHLTLLAGPSARRLFKRALDSHWAAAAIGVLSGLLTQSTNAVALIVVSFVRSGVITTARASLVPTWANVGASALVFLVALDTRYVVSFVLAVCGVCLFFNVRLSDQLRHTVLALMGTAMLLYGLDLLSDISLPLRDLFDQFRILGADSSAATTFGIGVLLAVLVQSSSVVGSIAVALVGAGVFGLDTALLLLLGANAGSGLNYAYMARSGEATGRHVLIFITLQKLAGSLLLLLPMLLAPEELQRVLRLLPTDTAHQLAVAFLVIQIMGALVCSLSFGPVQRSLLRLVPPRREDELAKPVHLVDEALEDADLALELAAREQQRLLQRLPQLLEHLRVDGDRSTLPPQVLCQASAAVAVALRQYLAAILDHQPDQAAIMRCMNQQQGLTNCSALHETLHEFVQAAVLASAVPTARTTVTHMIESLHMLLQLLVEAASSETVEEHDMTLALFAQRDTLMDGIRKRLLSEGPDTPPKVQEALFQTTVLFERILWLARDSLLVQLRGRAEADQT